MSAAAVWLVLALSSAGGSAATVRTNARPRPTDRLGIAPGKIKHVWLIILENKSYDATFTGLNKNTYLWKTLPSQGVLLKKYFGTGHFSFDNYISLVSGQAPQPDSQRDCKFYKDFGGHVDLSGGSLQRNPNYGQMTAQRGRYSPVGTNGCVYPRDVSTLFNQLDAAGKTWKGYAQDLDNSDGGGPPHSVGPDHCGAPFRQSAPSDSTNQPNPQGATSTDQYLAKHFPFPWFHSLLDSGRDCNAAHIANLLDPSNGLYHDLQHEATTPAFSWITPNMCSDGHDAVCAGNNLSGGWKDPNTPDPKPKNYTGGLYAVDLFLSHVVPEITHSPAFKDGGLIDITFDEAFPPFTYTHNSFYNSTTVAPDAETAIANDTAGETIGQNSTNYEPAGPNVPLNPTDLAAWPGPGNNQGVDRPRTCHPPRPATLVVTRKVCLLGAGGKIPGERSDDHVSAAAGSPTIHDDRAVIIDRGRTVAGPGIPQGAFVGAVDDKFVWARHPRGQGTVVSASFTLVDAHRRPLGTTEALSNATITLGAECAPGPTCKSPDPLYDDQHPTNGGGDTGSVLISPYITPGSCSDVFYNHYSWLRTIEDLFGLTGGVDGHGHLGYAAQPGLAPFGTDVFNRPGGAPHAPSCRPTPRTAGYGPLADRLPGADLPTGIVEASLAHPGLAVEGEPIVVHLPGGHVQITVAGPALPTHGERDPARRSFAGVFTVTLSAVSGIVPLNPRAFAVLDEYGAVHPLSPSGRLPGRIRTGHAITVSLKGDLPAGQGQLTWTPMRHTAIATWDYTLETN